MALPDGRPVLDRQSEWAFSARGPGTIHSVRRSIDDYPFDPADLPPGDDDEFTPVSWAVAIADDYEDAIPRVVLTVEEVGQAGYGLVAHLPPHLARRLRAAIGDALKEIGEAESA